MADFYCQITTIIIIIIIIIIIVIIMRSKTICMHSIRSSTGRVA